MSSKKITDDAKFRTIINLSNVLFEKLKKQYLSAGGRQTKTNENDFLSKRN